MGTAPRMLLEAWNLRSIVEQNSSMIQFTIPVCSIFRLAVDACIRCGRIPSISDWRCSRLSMGFLDRDPVPRSCESLYEDILPHKCHIPCNIRYRFPMEIAGKSSRPDNRASRGDRCPFGSIFLGRLPGFEIASLRFFLLLRDLVLMRPTEFLVSYQPSNPRNEISDSEQTKPFAPVTWVPDFGCCLVGVSRSDTCRRNTR